MRLQRVILFAVVVMVALFSDRHGTARSGRTFQARAAMAKTGGFVRRLREGEMLEGRNGKVIIKVDPSTGSARLAMGTQELLTNTGIPIHMHEHEDEILFVHRGSGTGIIGDERKTIEPGSTIYVPQGVWHGVENPAGEVTLVWVVSPPGLEKFFRETRRPPGTNTPFLTPEQLEDIGRKHGIRMKPR